LNKTEWNNAVAVKLTWGAESMISAKARIFSFLQRTRSEGETKRERQREGKG
jgi:hypothetical protein